MKRPAIFVCSAALALWGCSKPAHAPLAAPAAAQGVSVQQTVSADEQFVKVAQSFIEAMLTELPETASALGDHRFDARLNDYSRAGVVRYRGVLESNLRALSELSSAQLSAVNQIDYRILRHNLEAGIYQIDVLREYEWNPLYYNPGNAIYQLLSRDYAPLKTRLLAAKSRLAQIPELLKAARAQLVNPPKPHVETAIDQIQGAISLIKDELPEHVAKVPELKAEFDVAIAQSVRELSDYVTFLKSELLARAQGNFRLGDEKFRKKLFYSLESDLTKEQILAAATEDLKASQKIMHETAIPLYQKYFPKAAADPNKLKDRKLVIKAVLDKLAENKPTNKTILAEATAALQRQTAFVKEKHIVSIPPDPVKLIEMPEFQRGVAVAYCEPPGPLEKTGETFYAISPAPANWSPARVDSLYREYNLFMLEDLTVHEAMPGHYLQGAHANRFRAPTAVRLVFGSGTFVEGWAVYGEEVMADLGYGGAEVRMQQLKMRLRMILNAILDQQIHTGDLNEKAAMDLMMNEAFQEEGEAAGKWRRAILTSTQLSTYYVGYLEVKAIRTAFDKRSGNVAQLQGFHDQMLSYGAPAAKYIREAMGL